LWFLGFIYNPAPFLTTVVYSGTGDSQTGQLSRPNVSLLLEEGAFCSSRLDIAVPILHTCSGTQLTTQQGNSICQPKGAGRAGGKKRIKQNTKKRNSLLLG